MKLSILIIIILLLSFESESSGFVCYNGCDTADRLFTITAVTSFLPTYTTSEKTTETMKSDKNRSLQKIEDFLIDNMEDVAFDIAKGEGETLSAIAELLKVPRSIEVCFFQSLKAHFDDIFPSHKVRKIHVAKKIIKYRNAGKCS